MGGIDLDTAPTRARIGHRARPWAGRALAAALAVAAMPGRALSQAQPDALETACKARDLDRGIAACTQILDANPTDAAARTASVERGLKLQIKGEHAKAVADLTTALKLDPTNAHALSARGTSYVRLDRLDAAQSDFDEAIRLNPAFAEAFAGRSFLGIRQGNLDRAIADATEAIHLDPRQIAGHNNRGIALREKGDLDASLVDLNVAVQLNAYLARPLYNRGLTYFRQGNLQHALADYEASLVLDPKDREAVQGRDAAKAALAARGITVPVRSPDDRPAPPVTATAVAPAVPAPSAPAQPRAIAVVAPPPGAPAPAPAASAPSSLVKASREPDPGNLWKPFEARRLGLGLLVQEATNPADRYVFSERGDWLEQHRPADDTTFMGPRVIRVLHKPAAQSIDDAIAQTFVSRLPAEARASCRAGPTVPPIDLGPGKVVLDLVPTGAYQRKIYAELKKGPRDFGCGEYGKGQSTTYFEYHPDESRTTYLFVSTGFDPPLFDEKAIRILSTDQVAAAAPPAASPAPAEDAAPPVSLAAQIWSVALNKAPDGTKFCEATAEGRDAGFGAYSIRYRPSFGRTDTPAILIVTYAAPRLRDVRSATVKLDGRSLQTIPMKQIMLGRENALVYEMDGRFFTTGIMAEIEKPDTFLLAIDAGGLSFGVPVSGYAAVNANLEACRQDL